MHCKMPKERWCQDKTTTQRWISTFDVEEDERMLYDASAQPSGDGEFGSSTDHFCKVAATGHQAATTALAMQVTVLGT